MAKQEFHVVSVLLGGRIFKSSPMLMDDAVTSVKDLCALVPNASPQIFFDHTSGSDEPVVAMELGELIEDSSVLTVGDIVIIRDIRTDDCFYNQRERFIGKVAEVLQVGGPGADLKNGYHTVFLKIGGMNIQNYWFFGVKVELVQ